MARPTISAVVRAYNAEPYIAATVEAILSQTLPPDEVIVVDDGSTDGTLDVLLRFEKEIRLVRQRNQGCAGALNAGFAHARCDFAAVCDADDIWEPTKLECQVDALAQHPEIDVAFTGACVFGQLDETFVEYVGATSPPPGIIGDRRAFARTLYRANMICASAVLVRLTLQRKLGPFAELNEDYEFWLRAVKAGALFYYDPRVLVRCRRHEGNISLGRAAMCEAACALHRQHRDVVDSPWLVRQVLAANLFQLALAQLENGRYDAARQALWASIRQWPTAQRLAWAGVIATPERYRRPLVESIRSLKSTLSSSWCRAVGRRPTAQRPARDLP